MSLRVDRCINGPMTRPADPGDAGSPMQPDLTLVLADSDRDYTAALVDRLCRWKENLAVSCCHCPEELHQLITQCKNKNQAACFLYNTGEFVELKHIASSDVWPDHWSVIPLLETGCAALPSDGTAGLSGFHRYAPVSQLMTRIDAIHGGACFSPVKKQEAEQAAAAADPPDTVGRPDDPVTNNGGRAVRLWLTLSLTAVQDHADSRIRLAELVRQGRQVVYLPLMPTYEMDIIRGCSEGLTLSDLLLHVLGDTVKADDLGCYWQPHSDGYLCFRPPERADDLVTCSPDVLRQLVLLLKNKLAGDPTGQMIALIHCSGLPLASVAAVAVLCDVCEVDLPQGTRFTAVSAQVEAGRLLSLLPSTCQVIRHPIPENSRFDRHRKGGAAGLALSS